MNQEHHRESTSKKSKKFDLDFDDFQISEETFKPMTKGLGFHHETKKTAFKTAPREVKNFAAPKSPLTSPIAPVRTSESSVKSTMAPLAQTTANTAHVPSGLEAFYGATPKSQMATTQFFDEAKEKIAKKETQRDLKTAPMLSQFGAWVIDVFVIMAFVVLTAALLVFASGIELRMYSKLLSPNDLIIFATAMFSIYYLLYFTILDLGATPGKTIFGLKLVKTNGKNVAVKHAFFRALVSLISGVALFLPLLLDFQGRLTDTKVVE